MTEDEWRAARCGQVTASRVADIIRSTKSGPSASRARYMGELIAERLTGVPQDNGFVSAEMQRGLDLEAEARAAYAFRTGHDVRAAGMEFVPHPAIAGAGASPDTWVNHDIGLAEMKAPATHTHIDYLIRDSIPTDYLTQIHWQSACTGVNWTDFVSYDPRLPEHLSLWIKRVPRDDERIHYLERDVKAFLAELDERVEALKARAEI